AKPEERAEAPAAPAAPAPPMTETEAKPAAEPKPEMQAKPTEAPAPAAPAATPAPAPMATGGPPSATGETYEVKKGDTLGDIAIKYRSQGVSFHQMLIALQRANEDAFIRGNINLVRAGRILNIPDSGAAAAVAPEDARQLVVAQNAEFDEYRSRLGTAVAATPAAPMPAERNAAGSISPKPEAPKPAAPSDHLKLSRADAKKPGAPESKAARGDDRAARERALQEEQSRVAELEKNVADLKKLVELRNQQLAQLEQKAGPKPAVQPPQAPKPAPVAQPAAVPAAPVAQAPKPAAEAPKPAAEAPKPPAPAKPKPHAAPPPPPPEPSLVDEFLDNPVALGGLGAVVLLLVGYGAWAWQRKKKSISKFQDSVLGPVSTAAGPAGVAPAVVAGAAGPTSVSQGSVSQSPVGGVETDDVDPIAEADVYMAYGRDAQAEEILKESLAKDPNRVPVLSKLLEIYANRRDAHSFEQTALKLKGASSSTSPEWEKAAALGRNIDPGNGLYGGGGAARAPVVTAAAPAPAVDFDIGGGGGASAAPETTPALDLDLGGASVPLEEKSDFSPGGTLIIDSQETKAASAGLDFDLGGGAPEKPANTGGGMSFELPGASAAGAEPSAPAGSASGGLDFDLNLGGGDAKEPAAAAPALDLSAISLDLGTPGDAHAGGGGNGNGDPKWQEVATKLDLAKAYEEMGDKDGARELLNEVIREGDAAQQGQAQQLLTRLS
ncbi:MAG: FimV/HubP family polar landmark protein, partial [Burkholderiales bacterium]